MRKQSLFLFLMLLLAFFLGASEVTIGSGSQQARYPVDMYYRNSLYECIYLQSELNISGGLVTSVTFYNNFTSDLSGKPTRIWLGNTTQTNLSTGWIPSSQLTPVFDGLVDYPSGANNIQITFSSPFVYTGQNLVMLVNRPMDTEYYASADRFFAQTVGTNRARFVRHDTTNYDPANPPSTSTLTGQFPKTTFTYFTDDLGSLSGTVFGSGNIPSAGASVSILETGQNATTDANGFFNFSYVTVGNRLITASKYGYHDQSYLVEIYAGQASVQNIYLDPLSTITLSGRIVGSDNLTGGLAGVPLQFTGYQNYDTVTDLQGYFTIPGVYAKEVYDYSASHAGYQDLSGQITILTDDLNLGTLVMNELTSPVINFIAVQDDDPAVALLTWSAPGSFSGEWLHYDNGTNESSIGTGSSADFTVAVRFPPSSLSAYAGTSLQAVKVWPASAGTFTLRVWTGGNSTAPGTLVVSQNFTPVLNSYNTILLNNPVQITGTEELWFGMRCVVNSGYPAGCDAGPAVDGFGNMIYFQNSWSTLLNLAPSLNYNWNIQGFVGYDAPAKNGLTALNRIPADTKGKVLEAYQVSRLATGEENNPESWILLTPDPVTELAFADILWRTAAPGFHKWAVRSVYTNGLLGPAVISNALERTPYQDITALLLQGSDSPALGVPATYEILVKNSGNSPLSGSSYLVKLMNGDLDLCVVPGIDLAPGAEHAFPLTWTPDALGELSLRGVVTCNDQNPSNNETETYVVVVEQSLPVILSSFTAVLTGSNIVELAWVSQSESGMLGYRVYRNVTQQQSNAVQLTDIMVPATNTSLEHRYCVYDTEVESGNTYYYWLESVDFTESAYHGPVSVTVGGETPPVVPELSALYPAFPNPFRPGTATTIPLAIKGGESATFTIYNVQGKLIRHYSLGEGWHNLMWDGLDSRGGKCGSGIYFYRLDTPSVHRTKRLVLLK